MPGSPIMIARKWVEPIGEQQRQLKKTKKPLHRDTQVRCNFIMKPQSRLIDRSVSSTVPEFIRSLTPVCYSSTVVLMVNDAFGLTWLGEPREVSIDV